MSKKKVSKETKSTISKKSDTEDKLIKVGIIVADISISWHRILPEENGGPFLDDIRFIELNDLVEFAKKHEIPIRVFAKDEDYDVTLVCRKPSTDFKPNLSAYIYSLEGIEEFLSECCSVFYSDLNSEREVGGLRYYTNFSKESIDAAISFLNIIDRRVNNQKRTYDLTISNLITRLIALGKIIPNKKKR